MFILASNPTWNISRESFSTCMYNLDFSLLIVKLQAMYHILGVTLYIPLTLPFSSVYSDSFSFTLLYGRRKLSNKTKKKKKIHSLLDLIDMKISKVAKSI